jgi:hypothetical protein
MSRQNNNTLMRRYIFIFLLHCFVSGTAYAQNTISGTVTDAATGKALAQANIFISNTQKGTATDAGGVFLLTGVPEGKYDLIISLVGYETYIHTYKAGDLPLRLTVKLKVKIKDEEVATVKSRPFEKESWAVWGRLFTRAFIGESTHAQQCDIVNKNVIRFRYYTNEDVVEASASEMLVIENRALGYRIKYQLESFVYDGRLGTVNYSGFPLFEEMKERPKYAKNREKAYWGSVMHFMRSLFINSFAQEGFEIRNLYRQLNTEKERVKNIMSLAGALNGTVQGSADSLSYYSHILKQPDTVEIITSPLLSAGSILFESDSRRHKILQFAGELLVHYKNEKPAVEYTRSMPFTKPGAYQTTRMFFINDAQNVNVEANGNYYNPVNLYLNGYFGWERIGELLPFDYEPPKKEEPGTGR